MDIISAPKTDMFRMRINPEIRQDLEAVFRKKRAYINRRCQRVFSAVIERRRFPLLSDCR